MADNESVQLELFNEDGAADKRPNTPNSFFGFVRGYEKIVLLLILFIGGGIIFYSLGIEKGRRLAAVPVPAQPTARFDAAQALKQETAEANSQKSQPQEFYLAEKQPKFTIQLASFKNKTAALKEADILKKKGLRPLVLNKGKFIILCVGNFSDKNNANQTLSLLKRKYRDSYIRRL